MDNNQLVQHTYKKHHNWLSQVAYNFTQNKDNADELIQELYLKMMEMADCKKIMYNNDVNLFYLYKMVRSIHLNGLKKQTNHLQIDDDLVNLPADSYSVDADNEFERVLELTNEALDSIHWFESKLLRVYLEDNHSIQSLHNATGISNSTIFTSMKKTKQYVRDYVNKNM